jgi:hypothetical protein
MPPPLTSPAPPYEPALRARHDGWTPERQQRFLAALAQVQCVTAAAAASGMSVRSAYRMRRHPAGVAFKAGWDAAVMMAPLPPMPSLEERIMATETRTYTSNGSEITITRPLAARELVRLLDRAEGRVRAPQKRGIL